MKTLSRCLWALSLMFLLSVPARAAGKPLSLSLSPSISTVTEGQSVQLTLGKSGGNGRISLAKVTTSDGSFTGSIMPGTSFLYSTKDDTLVQGPRTITVTATYPSTGATTKALVTILDNDIAAAPAPIPTPPPPPPPVVSHVTTSAELLAFAAQVEAAAAPDAALDTKAVFLLTEPIKTVDGRDLSQVPAGYSSQTEPTAANLTPANWTWWPGADNATLMLYDPPALPGKGFEKFETYSLATNGLPLRYLAASVRAWAWILQQRGR